MKVRHTLIFFFLSLQDGNTGLVNAKISFYTGAGGENLTVKCCFPSYESRIFFCKEKCEQQDILIETTDVRAQSGRYRIDYVEGCASVTITQLAKSDSGWYRCGSGRFLSLVSYERIEIIVIDALLAGSLSEEKPLFTRTGGNLVVACSFTLSRSRKYFCKEECEQKDILVKSSVNLDEKKGRYSLRYFKGSSTGEFLLVAIEQLTKSDAGRYRCGLGNTRSQDLFWQFSIIVTDALTTSEPSLSIPSTSTATTQNVSSTTTTTTRDVLLCVGVALVVMVLLSLSVLIFCRKTTCKAKEPPVETQYASVTENNRVYEDVGEDRRSTSLVETNNAYSVAPKSQNTGEDAPSLLTYSEIQFSNRAASSSYSGVRADCDAVVYAVVPRGSDGSRAEDDPPVYSTVH